MKNVDFECEKCICQNAGDVNISYRLFSSQNNGEIVFSLCVELIENGELTDERFVFDISRCKEEAENIFMMVHKNTVTPYSLDECLDAVYDILSER
ncbi:MAG: hypothetical protein IKL21_05840 [Clostridia bacterium]|nr:hypothetical protein [Clostridia bacterium]